MVLGTRVEAVLVGEGLAGSKHYAGGRAVRAECGVGTLPGTEGPTIGEGRGGSCQPSFSVPGNAQGWGAGLWVHSPSPRSVVFGADSPWKRATLLNAMCGLSRDGLSNALSN